LSTVDVGAAAAASGVADDDVELSQLDAIANKRHTPTIRATVATACPRNMIMRQT